MTEEITVEVFQHLVALAALEMDEAEAEYLRRELNKQLKAIHELEAIPLKPETPPASHGVPYTDENTPPIRLDEWLPDPSREDIAARGRRKSAEGISSCRISRTRSWINGAVRYLCI
jgi:Asp-tRNA(Asn)/Glu-tRNA(Gln) amidotransferase C subunit